MITPNRAAALVRDAEIRARIEMGRARPPARKRERNTPGDQRPAPVAVAAHPIKPVASPLGKEQRNEARRLRRMGWSLDGLARRYGCDRRHIEAALSEGAL